MALINHAKREINAKIVYYGHEGAGKRTSLQYIYDRVRPTLRGELKTLSTGGDSLFFFDFSPFEKTLFGGYHVRFHMYSLTGKVTNPAAWKMTLKGADGLVIVADAVPDRLPTSRESVAQLRDFLAAYGVGLHDIPAVLQLNMTGADRTVFAEATASALDLPGVQTCLSLPAKGEGVLEALTLLSRAVIEEIGQDEGLRGPESAVTSEADAGGERVMPVVSPACEPVSTCPASSGGEHDASPAAAVPDNSEPLQVSLTGGGAVCADGVVRIPLELTAGGVKHRLTISVAIDQE